MQDEIAATTRAKAETQAVVQTEPRSIALVQLRRGHGVSTAAYYLARALTGRGLHVLVGDLSQRSATLIALAQHEPARNLVPWRPAPVHAADLARTIAAARQRTAGLADVMLLDIDAPLFEQGGGLAAGMDMAVLFTEHTEAGEHEAAAFVERVTAAGAARRQIGVIFSRVQMPADGEPPSPSESELPVLGSLPADYLLAAGEAYSYKGGGIARPHQAYLDAIEHIARTLVRTAGLSRATTPGD
jgi:hypothetical protein